MFQILTFFRQKGIFKQFQIEFSLQKLVMNTNKSISVFFFVQTLIFSLKFGCEFVSETEYMKLLSSSIDEHLNVEQHVNTVFTKSFKTIGLLHALIDPSLLKFEVGRLAEWCQMSAEDVGVTAFHQLVSSSTLNQTRYRYRLMTYSSAVNAPIILQRNTFAISAPTAVDLRKDVRRRRYW